MFYNDEILNNEVVPSLGQPRFNYKRYFLMNLKDDTKVEVLICKR